MKVYVVQLKDGSFVSEQAVGYGDEMPDMRNPGVLLSQAHVWRRRGDADRFVFDWCRNGRVVAAEYKLELIEN